jgi:signal transduction histidine kinase
MGADDLLQYVTQALFVLIFLVVLWQAIRQPLRANVDIALLFGVFSLLIAEGIVLQLLDVESNRVLTAVSGSLLMAHPYLMLRLVDDFAVVPAWLMRLALVGLGAAVVGLFAIPPPLPAALALVYVVAFAVLEFYTVLVFIREARRASGVTRRRMRAVAIGSALLGMLIVIAGFQAVLPDWEGLWTLVAQGLGLASGIAYFLGFATPAFLRRAWQEPELRAFLGRAASLPRLPETPAIVRELERGAATSIGAPRATIGLWDGEMERLRFAVDGDRPFEIAPGEMIAGRAFATQRAIYVLDAARVDPDNAETYRAAGAEAVIAAPITAGERRLGVLVVLAPRAPIFADDDLGLAQLLADQAAVILESRALIDEAARVRAREEAARLKDDFLSAAAHDLKTPLTTLIAQAQLLVRRAERNPEAPVELSGLRRIVRESKRLNALVLELLDASRLERGQLLGPREETDLAAIAEDVCRRTSSGRHHCRVTGEGPVVGLWDRARIAQVVENLIENAVKYSPSGGEVAVRAWQDGDEAHLTVRDEGIGIPPADLPHIFDRFHRGANVDDRSFSGMGLGLFICRGIVEQHGGRIRATSEPGKGSTFHVTLPLHTEEVHHRGTEAQRELGGVEAVVPGATRDLVPWANPDQRDSSLRAE